MSKKILLVSTSATEMGGNPTGLWIAELAEPYYAFKAAGYDITIASPQGGACPIDAGSMKGDALTADSKKFMHDAEAFGALSHSVKLDAAMTGFDCVYLCGGHARVYSRRLSLGVVFRNRAPVQTASWVLE